MTTKLLATFRTLALTGLLAVAASAFGQTIVNVSFTNISVSGSSPYPGSGPSDVWTTVPNYNLNADISATVSGLVDINGASTPFGYTQSGGEFKLGGFSGNALSVFEAYAHAGISPSMTLTLALIPNATYDLYVYSGRKAFLGAETNTITVGATSKTTSYLADATQDSFSDSVNYVQFSNLVANGSGQIQFTVTGILNGFTIVGPSAIPEPSTYALLFGLGTIAVVAMRRRRKA